MSQSKKSELDEYVRLLGDHINRIYSRIEEINKKVEEAEAAIASLRAEVTNNGTIVSNLRENTVPKLEFDEFVSRLTESLKELLPPIPARVEEAEEKGQ
jgi:L-rhamnose isomerase